MSGGASRIRQRLAERKQKTAAVLQAAFAAAPPAKRPKLDPPEAGSSVKEAPPALVAEQLPVKEEPSTSGIKEEKPLLEPKQEMKVEAKPKPTGTKDELTALLTAQSAKPTSSNELGLEEKETAKMTKEILEILNKPTAKELALNRKFKSDGSNMQEFCAIGTRDECERSRVEGEEPCPKLHFRKIIQRHTDTSVGDCSFLNTCFHMDSCKYIHYEVDYGERRNRKSKVSESSIKEEGRVRRLSGSSGKSKEDVGIDKAINVLYPAQWIQCDLRFLDLQVLGKCSVVMADPPWDIHMELPYGTMQDDEMRSLNVGCLQDEGLIFLWVTGRAMELGRDCLRHWGYRQCDEIIWVKTNQLQRIIRTGRTGHWLNHGKEHCLVGIKGKCRAMELGRDCLRHWGYRQCDEIIWVKTNQLQRIIRTGRTGHWLNHGKEHCLVGIKGKCRAMELGRDCLRHWGYRQCDEIIWVKTNQLQRIIRTGRTGHWLNHGKEHCLVGIKGKCRAMELGRDCLRHWGYRQCDEIIWVKTNQLQRIIRTGRTGHWLNHGKEHCLVGIKGKCRAMELGRDCLRHWGYRQCDEIIWVKTNQLQRIIRTGRTGHWLNHGKEHCLVGIKGKCRAMELGRDCLRHWGYRQCDEIIWVKTNQLQRIIRTGRTGHWLNHGKEHCLVGIKGKCRAMELGRDCLRHWGYRQCDEIIWVKTNQLQRIIRTGRTGHWLNHGKEHCLVGIKGKCRAMELGRDCLRHWGYRQCDEIIWVKTNQLQRIIRTGRTGHWLNHGKEHCLVGIKGKCRAMELGRDCLRHWGYRQCDEIIWVKTNQLQRIIRTGRTGHWLNHGKEHCLVGIKGKCRAMELGRDCLRHWGYRQCDEIIWVKTNQLQRIIRTGRTGHWLNHGKEHCLVGIKGKCRAMELGRDCLRHWGYRQCDEIIWVKTNQLQRIIRTGRTGHWLNHGKEHCLVGIKGEVSKYHRGLDCDVIVGEVRATSHKPDEIYGIIERLSPGTRKVELFGRHHNTQPNWITLGNQLDGVRLLDPELVSRFQERYPTGSCLPTKDDVFLYRKQQEERSQAGLAKAPRR